MQQSLLHHTLFVELGDCLFIADSLIRWVPVQEWARSCCGCWVVRDGTDLCGMVPSGEKLFDVRGSLTHGCVAFRPQVMFYMALHHVHRM